MATPDEQAMRLIAALLSDPERFTKDGLAHDLLKEFQRGGSVDRLPALLHDPNDLVVRRAIWIASELPALAPKLLQDAIGLSRHPDKYVRYYALDVITVGTADAQQEQFAHTAERLEDTDAFIVRRAIYLISRASEQQLLAARRVFEEKDPTSPHVAGLSATLAARLATTVDIQSMIKSAAPLERRYGLAASERAYDLYPHLLQQAAQSSDESIKEAAAAFKELHNK